MTGTEPPFRPWLLVVIAIAFVAFVAMACAPPTPPAAIYDAANDVIVYDDAAMAKIAADWGQPGVEWIQAHEEGHATVMRVWRNQHVAIWTLMPGATAAIQMEQAAQCEAKAALGHGSPWRWGEAAQLAGYWTCPDQYVATVKAVTG